MNIVPIDLLHPLLLCMPYAGDVSPESEQQKRRDKEGVEEREKKEML